MEMIGFDNTYARLPEHFHARVLPTPVAAPRLVKVNAELAFELGIDPAFLASPEGVEILAGNRTAAGSEPLAIAYAGHQFGHFVPQLGDGRANLLGEVVARNGVRYDVQLKGSGRTPFSRGGDGRAAIGPVLREYLLSEAMHALGVPTARALAAVITGEVVYRETSQPGAILTRVAASHLRVGTFQYFAARGNVDALRQLTDFAIARHYPACAQSPRPYRAFLDTVITRQANLIAQWMLIGFIHGVMNTDNMSISGETIDYGPCAFMETYEPDKVYSSIDRQGRYAYSNQPSAAHWNLTRFAETLLPLLMEEEGSEEAALVSARESLNTFADTYDLARLTGLRRKLGLIDEQTNDLQLAEDLLATMAANQADFTLTFRLLCEAAADPQADAQVRVLFANPGAYDRWAVAWRDRTPVDPARAAAMRRANPAFIPRNHLVAAVIAAAETREDFEPFDQLLNVVTKPYAALTGLEHYTRPARPEECVTATFCGT